MARKESTRSVATVYIGLVSAWPSGAFRALALPRPGVAEGEEAREGARVLLDARDGPRAGGRDRHAVDAPPRTGPRAAEGGRDGVYYRCYTMRSTRSHSSGKNMQIFTGNTLT